MLDEEIVAAAGINAVSTEDDPVAAAQVHVVFLVSDDIPRDRPQAGWATVLKAIENPDIGAARGGGRLDRVRGQSKLIYAGTLRSGININFSRRLRVTLVGPVVIIFYVISRDLEVTHL